MLIFSCGFRDGTFAVDKIVNSIQSKFENAASPVILDPRIDQMKRTIVRTLPWTTVVDPEFGTKVGTRAPTPGAAELKYIFLNGKSVRFSDLPRTT